MPSNLDRAKARQAKAVYIQRNRIKRFRKLRAAVRRSRARIGKRAKLIARLRAELQHGPVKIVGDKASGGSTAERLEAVYKAAALAHLQGRRHSFYSQAGRWTVQRAITGERAGYRSDCSQFVTSVFWSAGGWRPASHKEHIPDPNGENYSGGYTGTLGSHGKAIDASHRATGALGFYGPYPHRHVEGCVGSGFVGHGSPPVDALTPGFPNLFRFYL